MTEIPDADEAFEFYVYGDESWASLIDDRWHDVRARFADWVLTGQLEVLEVGTETVLTLTQVRQLDVELVRRSLVRFRAHGALAQTMRSSPDTQYEIDPENPVWAIAFSRTLKGMLPRVEDPIAGVRPPCSPAEMPDLRLQLCDLWRSPAWQAGARAGVARARAVGVVHAAPSASLSRDVEMYVAYEQSTLQQAEMWWVGPEMCELLYATIDKVPDDTMLDHLTLPSTRALVVFAKPWHAIDADAGGRACIVDAITWGPARLRDERGDRFALGISAYRQLDFGAGLSPTELQLASATGAFNAAHTQLVAKQRQGARTRTEFNVTGTAWAPLGRSDWPSEAATGDSEAGYDDWTPAERAEPEKFAAYIASAVEDRKLVAALSLLLNTRTMTQLADAALPRPVRRRSQRAGVPSAVNVVTMRRPEHEHVDVEHDPDKPPVEWSHRWIVSAHVRLQPYGPGRTMRKLIMVPPHVKGPDDKPLVVKPTVKAWVR